MLFIPGNAGSHKQVRSLASVALQMRREQPGVSFDFFAGMWAMAHLCVQQTLPTTVLGSCAFGNQPAANVCLWAIHVNKVFLISPLSNLIKSACHTLTRR